MYICLIIASVVTGAMADASSDDATVMARHLGDPQLSQLAAVPNVSADEVRALRLLAEQAVERGIDYAALGLGWNKHPDSRSAYRDCRHTSCQRSRDRAEQSRLALAELAREMIAGHASEPHSALIAAAFAREIGTAAPCPSDSAVAGAAALAALEGELLLPLRALNEDRRSGASMTRTFRGAALPAEAVTAKVDEITARVLDGTFAHWRYANPVGAAQVSEAMNRFP